MCLTDSGQKALWLGTELPGPALLVFDSLHETASNFQHNGITTPPKIQFCNKQLQLQNTFVCTIF